MLGETIFEGIKKPDNWPANAKECELENLYSALIRFIEDPSYKNKEILVALADNYDLNQKSLLGLYRNSEYEVNIPVRRSRHSGKLETANPEQGTATPL